MIWAMSGVKREQKMCISDSDHFTGGGSIETWLV